MNKARSQTLWNRLKAGSHRPMAGATRDFETISKPTVGIVRPAHRSPGSPCIAKSGLGTALLFAVVCGSGVQFAELHADEPAAPRRVYVPYDDLDAVMRAGRTDPWGFVLMPAATVEAMLKAA